MEIKLRNVGVLDLKLYGFATEVNYENRNGKLLDIANPTAIETIELFYCVVMTNLQRNKKDVLSKDEFLDDLYDLNDGDRTILLFYKWYVDQKIAMNAMIPEIFEEKKMTKS